MTKLPRRSYRRGSFVRAADVATSARFLQRGVDLTQQLRGLAWRLADLDAGGLEGLLLRLGGARRARDDGAGVAHRLALGGGEARDVADDRLGDVGLDEVGRTLFGVAADLTDHDDRLG